MLDRADHLIDRPVVVDEAGMAGTRDLAQVIFGTEKTLRDHATALTDVVKKQLEDQGAKVELK